MIRESPTRASLGIIEVADSSTAAISASAASSISSPKSVSTAGRRGSRPMAVQGRVVAGDPKIRSASRAIPRTGTLSVSAGDTGHQHAAKVAPVLVKSACAISISWCEHQRATGSRRHRDCRFQRRWPARPRAADGSSASGVGALAGRVFIHHDSDNDGISYFDTEMLELSIAAAPCRRHDAARKPTLRSTGRTTLPSSRSGDFASTVSSMSSRDQPRWRQYVVFERRSDAHRHDAPRALIITGPGEQAAAQVRGFSGPGAIPTLNFLAYADTMLGGVRVAVGDVNGDKTEDIIVAPGSALRHT
jgi:hypothetical protein